MDTITLSREDFKEEAHWIALCDSLDVPNTIDSIVLDITRVQYVEPN